MKPSVAAVLLIVAVCTGQSLAFYDDVEQGERACNAPAYAMDNQQECLK